MVPPARAVPVYITGTGLGGTYSGYPEPEPEVLEGVALKLAAAWYLSATPAQIEAVTEGRPQIPAEVDRVLLHDATDVLGIVDLSTETRFALRRAFWRAYDTRLDTHLTPGCGARTALRRPRGRSGVGRPVIPARPARRHRRHRRWRCSVGSASGR